MVPTFAPKRTTVRQQNTIDLLSLHAQASDITELLNAGSALHTVLSLYPFDIEDYVAEVAQRVQANGNFPSFSSNMHRNSLFATGTDSQNSSTHLRIELGYLAWVRAKGTYEKLSAALMAKSLYQYSEGHRLDVSNYTRRSAKEASELLAEVIYKSLAFAAAGATEPDLYLASAVKTGISHTLLYLRDPEIYKRWGFKNRI